VLGLNELVVCICLKEEEWCNRYREVSFSLCYVLQVPFGCFLLYFL
jgi:hypothetical protein